MISVFATQYNTHDQKLILEEKRNVFGVARNMWCGNGVTSQKRLGTILLDPGENTNVKTTIHTYIFIHQWYILLILSSVTIVIAAAVVVEILRETNLVYNLN